MGILKRKSTPKAVVGLDLDSGHVAAAEVHVNGSLKLTRGAVAGLRPGIVRDGEVTDVAALTEVLKTLWSEQNLPKRVRLGVANQRIVVRTLDLPPLADEKAIASAVKVEAPDHIPMPMEEAVLDFQTIGLVDTPKGQRTRVVVVAVRREMVERYADAVRAAGLQIEGIDLSAFAMVRALGMGADQEGVLCISVAGLTNVAVASRGSCLFTRSASMGLDALVQTLADRRSLTLEHAAQWLRHVGLVTPLDEVEGDGEIVAAARAVLEEGAHQVADAVRNSLNFYRMQDNAERVDRAVLTGPAADIEGFADALATSLGLPVEAAVVAHDEGVGEASRLTVAAGLAVEAV